ncbi:META domain-containing protein [Paracoccus sediminicola]|uniref:META domain-containing protein n=1 Tax=Paracoccus sediminicola TaxID=3017783 RepID=UPI0022F04214|nr:META domain-containing protein [Paracoccus sediminicola]WBU57159.1 META domain-containing protein [Paracoccus sediminicola]
MKFSDLVLAGGLLLAGCGQTPPGFEGSYRLLDIDGAPIPGSATLHIAQNSVSGQGPCNLYRSENVSDWPQVDLGPIAITRRACLAETGEDTFFGALEQTAIAARDGRILTLTGPDHVMRFRAE